MTTFVILLKGNPLEHSLLAVAIIACQALYIALTHLQTYIHVAREWSAGQNPCSFVH